MWKILRSPRRPFPRHYRLLDRVGRIMKRITHVLGRPALVLAVLVGLVVGIGFFIFVYAEGFSYFSTDPVACVNCHVMREEYDSWQKASHHAVAKCVDCH